MYKQFGWAASGWTTEPLKDRKSFCITNETIILKPEKL